ncbi:PREDICTED: putative GPI-anchored protein pfl2 isoform X1 [Bactrocera latifrons]|nr:PREDICTED: putative GPI-anchored protein pfl2 isoform X1 [Bactrocera latifrons]XP_018799924.1 PREDICTED: putative GPI-anchored protein pfl2 isoform X1 [Bactrocera latifrons]XP_018799925.1 PREDICTED: putative GPI-anchored protein pfl2 isoform X1 [Bactrocera latifrons]
MSSVDASGGTGGGGAPGPGGSSVGGGGGVGSGGGPGGGNTTGTLSSNLAGMGSTQATTGEAQKNIKTHFIQPNLIHQNEQHQAPVHSTVSAIQSPMTSTITTTTTSIARHQQQTHNISILPNPYITTSSSNNFQNPPIHSPVRTAHLPTSDIHSHSHNQTHAYSQSHTHQNPRQFIKTAKIHPFSFNPVSAKISHSNMVNTGSPGGSNLQIGSNVVSGVSTIMTSSVSTTGAIKMTTAGGAIATSIGGTPIALNVAQSSSAIRTIGAGGQSTQVRVVMPTNIIPIKQFEGATGVGRTQITAIPAGVTGVTSRTVSNTSITVTRPVTQTTYLPRAGVTATQMTAVGSAQRLVTPIRTGPGSVSMGAGTTVTGLTAAGSFVRGTAATVNRNTSSPATSGISPATNTTWMQTNTGGQVQLIRTIPQPTQKRIITAQSMNTTSGAYNNTGISGGLGTSVGGTVLATTPPTVVQTAGGGQTQTQQGQGGQSTIQSVSSSGVAHSQPQSQQQQTYVATLATVLPQRQHQATLVYSSNVAATSQPLTQQTQQFNPTLVAGQRLAVAAQLSGAGTSVAGTTSRQIRPIPIPKSFSAAKLNTTSISIRAPNITSTIQPVSSGGVVGSAINSVVGSGNTAANNSPRNTTMSGVTTGVGNNVIPTSNLPTTRIIQLQQQPGSTTQPIIGSTGRISGNVMFQPIIVNTSGTGKLVSGLRQPVSMTAKPSLTITPFGLGKLPTAGGGNTTQIGVNLPSQQNVTTSIQSTLGGNNSGGGSGGNGSPAISSSTPTSSGGGVTNLTTAQLVNVSQAAAAASQLLTTQNIVSSGGGGGTTVLPLAITTRGSNILTGTITPLKNAGAITVGKVMSASNASNLDNNSGQSSGGSIITSSAGPPSVYIHQANTAQRTHGASVSVSATNLHAASSASSNSTTVLTATGGGGSGGGVPTSAGAFLPPGGTIYYESVPASSVQVSTGVLSLTTTTATSSTLPITQNQLVNAVSASNLAISSLPFAATAASHAGNSTATFTVVPSSGGRSIGQLQIPVSSAAGTQIQSVPLRFSAQLPTATQGVVANASSSNTISADAISVSQATQQLLQHGTVTGGQQLIIPASAASSGHHVGNSSTTATLTGAQGQHVVIPLQTSIKVTGGGPGSTVVSNFLRKRDADGSPIRAAKNLQPTLLAMGNNSSNAGTATILSNVTGSPAASSVGSAFSITSVASSSATSMSSAQTTTSSTLTTEALAKKDRAQASLSGNALSGQRVARGASPASSDGSTTVSANSSPGVEQQMQDGNIMMINHMPQAPNDSTHFNPINEMYANHHGNVNVQHNVLMSSISVTPNSSRTSSLDHHAQLHAPVATSTARVNGGPVECSTRKRNRRSTNDSQLSSHSQSSLTLPPPTATGVAASNMSNSNNSSNNSHYELSAATGNSGMLLAPVHGSMAPGAAGSTATHQYDGNSANANASNANVVHNSNSNHKNNNVPPTTGNKENAKPTEFTLRRPRNFSLLHTYKQNWKTANNHFQRYSDVKPREERRPTVIDLANQTNVMGKLNGWKIHHLSSQMEDLCENESNGLDQLNNMLKQMETHEKNPETERINELLKGNIQRSKIIVDGIHEAQSQMMKIFEHKSHISDILQRCASKRNFKKREKF